MENAEIRPLSSIAYLLSYVLEIINTNKNYQYLKPVYDEAREALDKLIEVDESLDKHLVFDMQPPALISKTEHLRAVISILASELLKNDYEITLFESGVANKLVKRENRFFGDKIVEAE